MNYVTEAVRTLSNEFHGELVSLDSLYSRIRGAIMSGDTLDQVKKALFYGRPAGSAAPMAAFSKDNARDFDKALAHIHPDPETARIILHAAIGLYTEASELLEAVYKCMKDGAPLDRVNLTEESGDSKWYLAIMAYALGNAWHEDEVININKLRNRFPDKFTEHRANTRDLDAERAVLESGVEDGARVDETVSDADLARQRIGEQSGMEPARKFFKGE